MFKCFRILSICVVVTLLSLQTQMSLAEDAKELKVGMIGLDTSHSIALRKYCMMPLRPMKLQIARSRLPILMEAVRSNPVTPGFQVIPNR